MKNALVLASEDRLSYRVLRVAAQIFDRVFILGTSNVRSLKESPMCAAYFRHAREVFLEEDIAFINDLSHSLSIDCVLPSDAHTTEFLAGFSDRITSQVFPVPSKDAFVTLNNKESFWKACLDLGLPNPTTAIFQDLAELRAALESGTLKCPFVMKPVAMCGGVGVKVVRSGVDIPDADYSPILVQDFVPGREIVAFFLCRHGKVIAEVAYQHEPKSLLFLNHEKLRGDALSLIEHFNFHGVIGFDVIERADGSLAFLECNPRFWYNFHYVMLAGLNFIEVGLSPKEFRHVRRVTELRVPKISSMEGARGAWRYGWVGLKVLAYYLADLKRVLEERQQFLVVMPSNPRHGRTG